MTEKEEYHCGVRSKNKQKRVRNLRRAMLGMEGGRRKKICNNCGTRNSLDANFCRECGSALAKAKFDSRLKEHYVWDSVRLDDPFTYYIIEWLDFLRQNFKDSNSLVWAITRQRAWQICKRLGIMNHTQRHWRATQPADAMDPFTVKGPTSSGYVFRICA